ncbi:MAG TPA: hypothetical protein VGC67_15470 [Cellulomonas sp.]
MSAAPRFLPRVRCTIVIAAALLAGCSSGDDGAHSLDWYAAEARSRGYDWQAGLLEDGDVTLAEYDEGHRRNLACLDAAGIDYSEPERNVLDGFGWNYDLSWSGLDEETFERIASGCFEEFVGWIEPAMSELGDWQTEPTILAAIKECVAGQGFEIDTGAQNYRDVWLSGSDQGLTTEQVSACIGSETRRLGIGVEGGYGF